MDMNEVLDTIDAAAKQYPMKRLAGELGKVESSLRNELNGQEGYKLGFFTAVDIIRKCRLTPALDWIEAQCGRIAHKLPKPGANFGDLCALSGELAVQFGEQVREFGIAMLDGKVSKGEGERWLNELVEANQKGLELQAALAEYLRRGQP